MILPRFQLGRIAIFFIFSISLSGLFAQAPLYVSHWDTSSDPTLTAGSAGAVTTSTFDTICSQVTMQVADTGTAPLPAFSAYIINPLDAMGNDVADLSGNMRIYFRAKSREAVELSVLLRSGGGAAGERSDRVGFIVPGDTANWSTYEFEFTPANIAGFDSTDLRDIWFYLDRGVNNFAGNEFVIDYVSIGAAPDSSTWSTCGTTMPPMPAAGPLYVSHWDNSGDPDLSSGNAGSVSTATFDTTCSQVTIQVADTANAPLTAFSAYIINPQDSMGSDIADLSGNMRIYFRAKSREAVELSVLLRSGGGASGERTDRVAFVVPGDTSNWSTYEFEFTAANLAGFDSTDLRDIWFYLDRGVNNFAGNEFVIDYVSIGAAPDSATWSTCGTSNPPMPVEGPLYTVHWSALTDSIFSGSSAASLTQTIDEACSQIKIEVTDPTNVPLSSFSPIIMVPRDSMGNNIVDLSGKLSLHLRVRSIAEVSLGLILRSGDGTSAFRTNLQEQIVPADTMNWTDITFQVDAATLGGFDSTDLRDIWLFLDRGTDNFAGNEFYLDYLSIGEAPNSSANSSCSFLPPFEFPYVVHWADTADRILSGTGAVQLTQVIETACSQLSVSVTDPVGDPLAAFRPLIINPADQFGNDITDLSGQMTFTVRIRSAGEILLGMLLRAGDGTMPFRTETIEKIVPGDLTKWTEVEFTFTGTDYAGFDSTDLRDLWLYFDRETPNFNGNEVYIDYVSIGSRPDTALDSDCVQSVGIEDDLAITGLKLYPNPSRETQSVQVDFLSESAASYRIDVYNMMGNLVHEIQISSVVGEQSVTIDADNLPAGMYLIQVVGANKKASLPWIIQ